jgi:predicted RNase H-like HicB family nuclease
VRYLIVIERSADGFGAYVPDLPGCAVTATTEQEVVELIREGIKIYIEEHQAAGQPVPAPSSRSVEVEVQV